MSNKIQTVKEAKAQLIKNQSAPDIDAIIEEAKELGLDEQEIIRICGSVTDDGCRRKCSYDGLAWGRVSEDIPVSSTGRLQYELAFDTVKVPKRHVGWAEKDESYSGQNFVVENRRIYLLGKDFLPVPRSSVRLNLSNSAILFGKEPQHPQISPQQADQLISQATAVIDLILQNPKSRSCDPYYGGYHAADLVLDFDVYTSSLNPNLNEFETASSQVNGDLAFGSLDAILRRTRDKSSIVLLKQGRHKYGSSSERLAFAVAPMFR